jgi:predicted dinucleotide-binding enzyme
MKIAVLGTGMVGQALAGKLSELGHEVTVGTRDVDATLGRTDPGYLGNPPFAVWQESHPGVGLETAADAVAEAELIVNATNGEGSIAMLELAGEQNLTGNVLIDIANPLDFSQGRPPFLFVSNTDSLGEQIQRRFPHARVVKALNTMNCEVMVDPSRVLSTSVGPRHVRGRGRHRRSRVSCLPRRHEQRGGVAGYRREARRRPECRCRSGRERCRS